MGISALGDFIYLVAINVLVLNLTGSAAAVAGLWIISPIASLMTKLWSGSLIDRYNIRRMMIGSDIARAVLVALIPFLHSIGAIYSCLFALSICKAIFDPASLTYITSIVEQENRKKFNSFRSLMTSGAFLVGPAISGALLLITSVNVSIWINAVSFLVSAFMIYLLPNVKNNVPVIKMTFNVLKNDWKDVFVFSKENRYIVKVYLVAQLLIMVAMGMDAQEVVFTQKVLGLSETDFAFLISLTGIGSILGATTISVISKKLTIKSLISLGYMMVATGYLIYAFSFSFWSVAFGFMILGYFNSFSNTGIMTFFQNNIPLNMMGRISSVFGIFQSLFQILFILLIGFTGDLIPVRYTIIAASSLMLCISLYLVSNVLRKDREAYFQEESESISKSS